MASATRTIDINVPASAFMEVVCDFERYPDFVSSVLGAEIEAAFENFWRIGFDVVLFRRRLSYTLKLIRQSELKLSWELLEADWMSRNDGSWTLVPLEPERTRVTYSIAVDVDAQLPHHITSLLIDASVPRLLRDFKRRAERLVGLG